MLKQTTPYNRLYICAFKHSAQKIISDMITIFITTIVLQKSSIIRRIGIAVIAMYS